MSKRAREERLPPGWEEHYDGKYQKTYYHHAASGRTVWDPPKEERDDRAAPRRPPPPPPPAAGGRWEEFVDEGTSRSYWHNAATGETTWTRPASAAAPPRRAAAADGADAAADGRLSGRVKVWYPEKGFGFVIPDGGGTDSDVFCPRKALAGTGGQSACLIAGEQVWYTAPVSDRRGGKYACTQRVWGPGVDSGGEPGQLRGKVKVWYQEKNIGFIVPDDGSADVFVHRKAIVGGAGLDIGGVVYYDPPVQDRRGGTFMATNRVVGAGVAAGGGGGGAMLAITGGPRGR